MLYDSFPRGIHRCVTILRNRPQLSGSVCFDPNSIIGKRPGKVHFCSTFPGGFYGKDV